MTYSITKDDYFSRSQPAKSEELVNQVSVPVTALTTTGDPLTVVYQSESAQSLAAGASVTIKAKYQGEPVIDAVAALEDAPGTITITNVNYYSWGASVTVTNSAGASGSFLLVIEGTVLEKNSDEFFTTLDPESQSENGVLKYEYPANHLMQSREMAALVASKLLASYKTPRKDTSLNWRGDPAVELGDVVQVPEYQRGATTVNGDFIVIKNKIDFDGTLKGSTDGRKKS